MFFNYAKILTCGIYNFLGIAVNYEKGIGYTHQGMHCYLTPLSLDNNMQIKGIYDYPSKGKNSHLEGFSFLIKPMGRNSEKMWTKIDKFLAQNAQEIATMYDNKNYDGIKSLVIENVNNFLT